jgi:hypothetical protein
MNPQMKLEDIFNNPMSTGAMSLEEIFGNTGTIEGARPFSVPSLQVAPTQTKTGFFQGVGQAITKRGENVAGAYERQNMGIQTPIETGVQLAGQTIGAGFDIAFEGIKSVLGLAPESLKNVVGEAGQKFLETELAQAGLQALGQGVEAYGAWKEQNPRAAANLEALGNIASVIPVGKGVQSGGKVLSGEIKPVLGNVATKLESSAVAQSAGKQSDFVLDLVQPEFTRKVQQQTAGRTVEGKGILGSRTRTPDTQEALMRDVVSQIPEVKPNKTFLANFNAIEDNLSKRATDLAENLKANDFVFTRKELNSALMGIKEKIVANPVLTGDLEKTAQKLINKFNAMVAEAPAKGSSLLQVRKNFDKWVASQKGAKVFDPTTENAFSIVLREIRQGANDFLANKAPTVPVKQSLREQSALFNAMDNIKPKIATEANSRLERFFDKVGNVVGTKNRVVQGSAVVLGLGGLGAASAVAPFFTVLGGLGSAGYGTYKLATSPQAKKALSRVIKEVEKKIPSLPTAQQRELKDVIKDMTELLGAATFVTVKGESQNQSK